MDLTLQELDYVRHALRVARGEPSNLIAATAGLPMANKTAKQLSQEIEAKLLRLWPEANSEYVQVEIPEDELNDAPENPVVRRARLRVYQDGVVELKIWRHKGQHLGCSRLGLREKPAVIQFLPLED